MNTTPDSQNQLIHEIGTLILNDIASEGVDWASLALVFRIQEGAQGASGFYYDAAGNGEPAAPNDFTILEKVHDLQTAMRSAEGRSWHRCLIQIIHRTHHISIQFEYDDPNRWQINPKTLEAVKAEIRPNEPI